MTDLPYGWVVADLGNLVDVLDSMRVPVSAKERAGRAGPVPYYGATGRVGSIDASIFDEELVLLGEDGVQFLNPSKKKAYLISGPSWVNNHAHVLRSRGAIDPNYLCYFLNQFNYKGFANGTTRLKLTQAAMSRIPVRLPPLAEQRRIVALLGGQLSRLDAGREQLDVAVRRLKGLKKRILTTAVPSDAPAHWRWCSVGEAGKVELGRQRHPDWHRGSHMRPYLRVANVFEDRIDTSDVKEMDFPPTIFDKFQLRVGDILLNEGQSPELLGRPAMYRGNPKEVAFTNSLLRFRASPGVDPEWALLVFRRHLHARRFLKEVRITTNIAHLSAARFKEVEFPIPPLVEQKAIVAHARDSLARVDRLLREIEQARSRALLLRTSLLAEASAGRLAPQDPNDEPASELLVRIQTERAAAPPKQKAGSRRAPKELAAPPTRVTGDDYQQEALPL
ncbi:restriction endonuclease subunit S [Micromonospora sp. ALFpr18c]|uniref:restriction endonuclease subunit S n=1 Tax=unclassified Micromonospora TaxID=2617518 RepID=UPI00124AEA0E|nr:restriction endonuclease subunit S [Micromonospora sp. ALFpr18c]KAB1941873.1 restriction endonuclease subunit S [Micromonospora sp. ALFpr18c]